jgi:SWI/SNF-related matrix-associated actin-dependent regulator 1 of chromatin subfamily A
MSTFTINIPDLLKSLPRVAPAIVGDPERAKLSGAHDAKLHFDTAIPLLDYQRAGVKYILEQPQHRALLGDSAGLGKTSQLIAVSMHAHTLGMRTLFVVPPSLRENWRREINKFAPHLTVEVLSGAKPYKLQKTDVTVIGDATLVPWAKALGAEGFGFVGVDESHRFKNDKAKRSVALGAIASNVPAEGWVVLASGTPCLSRPLELVSQLQILGVLDRVFGSAKSFKWRYCDPQPTFIGKRTVYSYIGASNTQELHDILRSTVYIRRRKEDVLTELPPKRRAQVCVALSDADLKEYTKVEDDFLAWVYDKGGSEAVLKVSRAETITRLTALLQELGKAKVQAGIEHIESLIDADEPVVVFAHHRSVIDAILDECAKRAVDDPRWNAVVVNGGLTDEQKQLAVDSFVSGKANIFVGNYDSAGVGLTLTKSGDKAVTQWVGMQTPWTPSALSQAEDRIHRISQVSACTAWHLTAVRKDGKETLDSRLYAMLNHKQEVVTSVLDGYGEDLGAEAGSLIASLLEEWIG